MFHFNPITPLLRFINCKMQLQRNQTFWSRRFCCLFWFDTAQNGIITTSLRIMKLKWLFQYKFYEDSKSMVIRNAIKLQLYIEMKNESTIFNNYPLCINWMTIDILSMILIDVFLNRTNSNPNYSNGSSVSVSVTNNPLLDYS